MPRLTWPAGSGRRSREHFTGAPPERRLWCEASIGFYADDMAEAEHLFEEMVDVACRGEIGMGLHVCREPFSASLTHEMVDMDDEPVRDSTMSIPYPF